MHTSDRYLTPAFIWMLAIILAIPMLSARTKSAAGDDNSLGLYLRGLGDSVLPASRTANTVVFLLRFQDFGCLACFESFIEVADSVRSLAKRKGGTFGYVIFPQDVNEPDQKLFLKAWAKANDIEMPVLTIPAKEYEKFQLDYSTIAVVRGRKEIALIRKFPLSLDDQKCIFNALIHGHQRKFGS